MDYNLSFTVETQEIIEENANISLLQKSFKTNHRANFNFLNEEKKRSEVTAANFENQLSIETSENSDKKLENSALVNEVKNYLRLHQESEVNFQRIATLIHDVRVGFKGFRKIKDEIAIRELDLAKAKNKSERLSEQRASKSSELAAAIQLQTAILAKAQSDRDEFGNEIAALTEKIETLNVNFLEVCRAEEEQIQSFKEQLRKLDADLNQGAEDFAETKQSLEESLDAAGHQLKATLFQLNKLRAIHANWKAEEDQFETNQDAIGNICEKMSDCLQQLGHDIVVTEDTLDDYLCNDFQLFKQLLDASLKEFTGEKESVANTKIACEQQLQATLEILRKQKEECVDSSSQINDIQEGFAKKRRDLAVYNNLQADIQQLEMQHKVMLDQAMSEKTEITLQHNATKMEIVEKTLKEKQQHSESEMSQERTRKEFEAEHRSKAQELEKTSANMAKYEADKLKLRTAINTLKAKEKKKRHVTFSKFDRVMDEGTDSMMSSDEKRS